MQQFSFRRMSQGTRTHNALLNELEDKFNMALPERIIAALKDLEHSLAGYQVSRVEHSLQSATCAKRDGADIEMIVSALIHDLSVDLAPLNHSQFAATIIRLYVRSEVTWIIVYHGIFQMYYLGDAMGVDTNAREIHSGHKWFYRCEKFCERRDQMSFDLDYASYPLAHFEPMTREFFRGRHLTLALS